MTAQGVRVVETDAELANALAVRRAVFVDGQGVPEDRERDGKDGEAVHFVASDDGRAIGAARLREIDPSTGKVERVAVREPRRGEGWGRQIVAAVETTARDRGLSTLVLHSQTHVEGFYADLGYESVGEEFEDAGIPHVEMQKSLVGRGE
jgi:predicted GNAT family N-acyltransferase